ncbi:MULTISPECIES: DNA-3-methyladenine glycosylase I [Aerococcus]|uniref:DNA-3-methyladenine glycosylase I n=1 Tax=Aerococcus TaxID=1375 RepID=UPI000DCC9DA4|nr:MULTISPECIES: DNA-3-methyladenine glycosylase I [Aerococcus]KAA9298526.1 DNA-3-methyladenine glycosylase I [Aerococcus tenax]MDK6688708.1 DNA-3-methyladenine glycosylase I [Aerococcus urinae]MDK8133163.1 DNA-3-methyladenine glycosylase I [Aerococcus urinae]MDK8485277.1 DNA-3-methyladenine glycosylase I [Aerococcus urinae]MDL5177825.1 DNA-3-methyladenine glycosylase I [Aerococcus tenax]
MQRCHWCNLANPLYISYHDQEWGLANFQDDYLFEMLILESFQAGLSWETVLNKRAAFRQAYDHFDVNKVAQYGEDKIQELLTNEKIIRHQAKIRSSIQNARVFQRLQEEYGSFYTYLCQFTQGKRRVELGRTTSPLSAAISKDLKQKGMAFVGPTIIYSYLQACGIIYSHERDCFLYRAEI